MPKSLLMRGVLPTVVALVCFAANSLLCRRALDTGAIDPVSFTTIRLASGAVLLMPLVRMLESGSARRPGSTISAAALFGYAIFFSLAYITLDAATGALLLFALVQITMIAGGLLAGERPGAIKWTGIAVAVLGLVYLLLPGLTRPNPAGAVMMAIAGISWGVYSLRGRGASKPIASTMGNFLRSLPLALALWVPWAVGFGPVHLEGRGILLAVVSGAITSGAGYAIWYTALRSLTATTAAVVQLSVPVIAAAGGALLLSEPVTQRLVVAGMLILGGIAITTLAKKRA